MRLLPERKDVVQKAHEWLPDFKDDAESKRLYLRLEHEGPHLVSTIDKRALSLVLAKLVSNGL